MFETSTSRVLAALPGRVAESFRALVESEDPAQDTLAEHVTQYLEAVRAEAMMHEFMDLETATRVAGWCAGLLKAAETCANQEHRQLIEAVARYFIVRHDAEDDRDSPIGFDDDALVAETVARELGLADVLGGAGSSQ